MSFRQFSNSSFVVENSCLNCGERICICEDEQPSTPTNRLKPIIKHYPKKDNITKKEPINGVDGKDGINGKNGQNGKDGLNGKDGQNGKDGKDGLNGKDGTNGQNGINGKDGMNGKDGLNGKDGISYTFTIENNSLSPETALSIIDVNENFLLPNSNKITKKEIICKHKNIKPILISTLNGSFILGPYNSYRQLYYDNFQWNLLGINNSFFPSKKRLLSEEKVNSCKISKNAKILVLQKEDACYLYKFRNMEHVTKINIKSNKYYISESGKYFAIQNENIVHSYDVISNKKLFEFNGILCGITDQFIIIYKNENLPHSGPEGSLITYHLNNFPSFFTLETKVDSINFNLDMLILGIDDKIQLYKLYENTQTQESHWILFKQITDKNNTDVNNSNFCLSADNHTMAITSLTNNKEQVVLVHSKINNNYILQTGLSFESSDIKEQREENIERIKSKMQYLQLSDDGNTLIWSNSNIVEIVVRDGENWILQTPIKFENDIQYMSLSGDGRNLMVVSGERVYVCN
jgi:hypothetical protein